MVREGSLEVTSSQFEVIKRIEGFVGQQIDTLLRPVNESWEPSDFLPSPSVADFPEQHAALRERARALSDGAAHARDYLCNLSLQYQKLADRVVFDGSQSFSWIYGREAV